MIEEVLIPKEVITSRIYIIRGKKVTSTFSSGGCIATRGKDLFLKPLFIPEKSQHKKGNDN